MPVGAIRKSNVDTLYEKIINEKIKEQENLRRLGIIMKVSSIDTTPFQYGCLEK
jgi:hypothetical protein